MNFAGLWNSAQQDIGADPTGAPRSRSQRLSFLDDLPNEKMFRHDEQINDRKRLEIVVHEEQVWIVVPRELLEILPKYGTLMQGKWNASETFEYRFDLNEKDGLFGCLARLRTGLFIAGFAIPNTELMTEEFGNDWIKPNELLTNPKHFSKKN
jgi:hypothetical protein